MFGQRPSRNEHPPRMLGMLALCAAFAFMAGWALIDPHLFAWFQWLFSDPEGFAVAVTLELVFLAGTLVLVPVARYAVGRTIALLE
jgi:hypothetical protein